MYNLLKNIFLIVILTFPALSKGQDSYPENYFKSPVDISIALSGTFGELRTNHFHSGIDIKTQGVEGLPMKAAADGFVSRIAVSAGGLGKVVYIDHPNGYTSVYGHLRNFSPDLEAWVKAQQYKNESFEVNLFPDAELFPVKKGDLIAFSGNSGSSEGPHLHFEIRQTDDEKPVNPLLFGFPVKDFTRPTISRLLVYPHGREGRVQGKSRYAEFQTEGWGENYRLKNNDTIRVAGEVYFGIETWDLASNSQNKNGVFSIELFVDNELVFGHKMEDFGFNESRYINSLIDYRYFQKTGRRVQKAFIEPNNHLSVYYKNENQGVVSFNDDNFHKLKYVVTDIFRNQSTLTFTVKSSSKFKRDEAASCDNKIVFGYKEDNWLERDNLVLMVPEEALYDTIHFRFSAENPMKGCYSPVFVLHDKFTPLHTPCELKIKPSAIPSGYSEKALIVRLGEKQGQFFSAGGKWDGAFLQTSIREFGKYSVMLDTIAPKITPVNIANGKNISQQKTIQLKIKDNLAGISSYRATLNGKWVLMEYDPKNELLTYFFDENLKSGKNVFVLEVTDNKQNRKVFRADLVR